MDFKKHFLNALIIAVLFALLAWLLVDVIKVKEIWNLLKWAVFFGGVVWCMKDVKGITNGVLAGLIYALVFLVVAVIVNFIPFLNYAALYSLDTAAAVLSIKESSIGAFFSWEGVWVPTIAFVLFTAVVGWVKEQK